MKYASLLILALAGAVTAPAAEPSGYYKACENKGGSDLLAQLQSTVGPHTNVGYDGLWNVYTTSDVRDDGTLWDMYSTKRWPRNFTKCGSYSGLGSCVNREHSFPKSWWGGGNQTQYSDAFHLYPTDGWVNGKRSNFPYGECDGGTQLPASGSVKALGKLGRCTFPGYSGEVFEPDDEYKGDFARSYFYLAAAYNDKIAGWTEGNGNAMLAGNRFPVFKTWAINLLLKWHRQDPVSTKERDRNDAVYAHQHNRNPFIDHPDMVEYIWGDKAGQKWMPAGSAPQLTQPVDGSAINVGATLAGVARTATVTVSGSALTADVSLTASGAGFSVSPATISRSAAQSADGATATVTFKPTATGRATGTLVVRSGSLTATVSLSGEGVNTIPAGPVVGIGAESFTAVWSYIGDTRSGGTYSLDVRAAGTTLPGYPRDVKATDEYFTVTGLEPLTTYTYTVSSASHVSNTVSVTTTEPVPYIDFLYDDEAMLYALAGEPSEPAEILMESAYIDTDITVSVREPFELSTDRSAWTRSLVLDPEEDRFYLRVNSPAAGNFFTSLEARAGDFYNDDADFNAVVTAPGAAFHEDFEADMTDQGTYNPHSYQGTMCQWNMTNAGMWGTEGRDKTQGVRMGKDPTSTITMAEDHRSGMGVVTLWAQSWTDDEGGTFTLEYSTDGGATWREAGSATTKAEWTKFTFTVNSAGPTRLRVRQTEGKRWCLDDIEATMYSGITDAVAEDYHLWDAYACGGELVITADVPVLARVYALDGTAVFHGRVAAEKRLRLPAGLYIVAVDDFARRVLVK